MTTIQKPANITPLFVHNEEELDTAIWSINNGGASNVIDIADPIVLTKDMTPIKKSLTLQSMNQSSITCGNHNGLILCSGAVVSLAVKIEGSVKHHGPGDAA